MTGLKKCVVFCFSALLMLHIAGCQNSEDKDVSSVASVPSSSAAPSPASASSTASVASSPSSSAASSDPIVSNSEILPDATVEWETKEYEDAYLKYQIPANWEQNKDYSNDANFLTFFADPDAATKTPSNVNIQITSMKNESKNIDYGNAEVQSDFHEFLLTQAGLPREAKEGTFTVYQAPDFYVYAISFSRTVDDGTKVQQTAYIPVGLDCAIMIWATDWNDGATPSVNEIALHMCATLEIK